MTYKVSVDIDLGAFQQQVIAQLFPVVTQAVAAVAEHGAYLWKDAVMKARLWSVEKQRYTDSISWKMTGSFSAEIWADYILAGEIETGRPAKDLKKYLQTSQRTRISKKGVKYLVIPFRHNSPENDALAAQMPKAIYLQAKKLSPSSVTGMGTRISATGATVPQASYNWGSRLLAGLAPKMKPEHKTDIYAGMVRMNTSAGKSKSSSYLTFRVMSETSTGWIVPAKPGLFLAQHVSEAIQPLLNDSIGNAISLSK